MIITALIEKRGVPDLFEHTGAGRSLAAGIEGYVRGASEPAQRVTLEFAPGVRPREIVRGLERAGFRVRSFRAISGRRGERLLANVFQRRVGTGTAPVDDLD